MEQSDVLDKLSYVGQWFLDTHGDEFDKSIAGVKAQLAMDKDYSDVVRQSFDAALSGRIQQGKIIDLVIADYDRYVSDCESAVRFLRSVCYALFGPAPL